MNNDHFRLLSIHQVQALTSLSRSTIWRLEQAGQFPRRLRIGQRRVAWRASDVNEWLASKSQNHATPPVSCEEV